MAKSIEAQLYRYYTGSDCCLEIGKNSNIAGYDFCWRQFRKVSPIICKDLRAGKTRKLKFTRLKRGFKLEVE